MSSPESRLIIRYSLSDIVSLVGLCLSCGALFLIVDQSQASYLALVLIFAGMLCDAYDGWVARKTQQLRPFGAFLDTNIDIITHLLVPLIWFWQWGFDDWYQLIILLLVLVSGITRLAVFNEKGFVKEENKNAYWGVPVFWCPIWIACFVFLSELFTAAVIDLLASVVLLAYAYAMLRARASYKPTSIVGISLLLCLAMLLSVCWPLIPDDVWQHFQLTFFMTLPLLAASHFNLLFKKLDLLKGLNQPIHQNSFGQNKTWRGAIALVIGSMLSCWLMAFIPWQSVFHSNFLTWSATDAWWIGAILGAAFILGELPNSYIKRRMNIPPGESPKNFKLLFILGDQVDSAWCVLPVYAVVFHYSMSTTLMMLVSLPLTFFFFRIYFFVIGLKASPLR